MPERETKSGLSFRVGVAAGVPETVASASNTARAWSEQISSSDGFGTTFPLWAPSAVMLPSIAGTSAAKGQSRRRTDPAWNLELDFNVVFEKKQRSSTSCPAAKCYVRWPPRSSPSGTPSTHDP